MTEETDKDSRIEELEAALQGLIDKAEGVHENWEEGNLAFAVTKLVVETEWAKMVLKGETEDSE